MQDDVWGESCTCPLGCQLKENSSDFSKHWKDCAHQDLLISQEYELCENNINHVIKKENIEKHYETCVDDNCDLLIMCFRAQIKELQDKFKKTKILTDNEVDETSSYKMNKLSNHTSNHIQINKPYIRYLYDGDHNEKIETDTANFIDLFLS